MNEILIKTISMSDKFQAYIVIYEIGEPLIHNKANNR